METPTQETGFTYQEAQIQYDKMLQAEISKTKKNIPGFIIGSVASFGIGSFFQHMAGTTMFSMYTFTDSVIWATLASPTFYFGWALTLGCLAIAGYGIYSVTQKTNKGLTFEDVKALQGLAAAEENPAEAQRMLTEADTLARILTTLNRH